MDAYEATKVVMSRIQSLDPENASKIMGYILIQDQGEKEMIRLAFGPEALLLSYISQAKACLGLSSSSPSSNPSTPLSNPMRPRILIPNNGFHLSNPSSPAAGFQRNNSPRPFSYAAALNGSAACSDNVASNGFGASSLHFYGGTEFGNEFLSGVGRTGGSQVQDQLSFLEDSVLDPIMSPSGRSDSLIFPYSDDASSINSPHANPFHRRSCSVNDAAFLSNLEEGGNGSGFGWRPCMYFARGHCKNGSSCKFLHSDVGGADAIEVGSPSKTLDDLLRLKAIQQQRFALMASGGHHPFAYNKCMDFLNENPRSTAAALTSGDEFRKYNFHRSDRNDFSSLGLFGGGNSSSRQIYLTFPADSTFKEEDVSNYFSTFGPVQDVRIPYQQKRMFGFVTFHYPETVKLILAKGNPHFVCDSRVLVKPYKEKGKIPDKKQQQHHLERGDYPACLSPSGIDSREHIDLPFGSRMFLSTQELMIRRKLEQEAELQHAIELQSRRMMNMQLLDLKNQQQLHHFLPNLRGCGQICSPRESQLLMNQKIATASDVTDQETTEELDGNHVAANSPALTTDQDLVLKATDSSTGNVVTSSKQQHLNSRDSDLPDSLEFILPDNLFASPTKLAAESRSVFAQASADADDGKPVTTASSNNSTLMLPSNSPLAMASLKSCYIQMQATEM